MLHPEGSSFFPWGALLSSHRYRGRRKAYYDGSGTLARGLEYGNVRNQIISNNTESALRRSVRTEESNHEVYHVALNQGTLWSMGEGMFACRLVR